jgi:hypothetical protein
MGRVRALAIKALRYAGLAAIFVAGLEVMARLDDALAEDAPFFGPYDAQAMLLDRDSLGIKGKAHGRFEKWVLNSKGFRGPDPAVPKPPGNIRIVTLGASETFGLYESDRKHWPAQLRRHIKARYPGRRIELINTGIVGLTMSSLERYYRHRVEELEPDLVILYPHFIDYIAGDGPGGRKRRETPVRVAGQAVPKAEKEEDGFEFGPPRFPGKLKLAVKTKAPRPILEWAARRKLERALAAIDTASQIDAYDTLEFARFDSLANSFAAYLRDRGVDLVVSDYACSFVKGSREETLEGLENLWRVYPWMSRKALVDGLAVYNRRLMEIADRNGALKVSQASLLEGYRENWVADGLHFTDQGATLATRNFIPVVNAWLDRELAARQEPLLRRGPVVQGEAENRPVP